MKRSFLIFFLCCSLAPALTAKVFDSEIMRHLWDIPSGEVHSTLIKKYRQGKVIVEELRYQSRSYQRQPTEIFGYFCYPVNHSGKLPAILLSHGGGGQASRTRAVEWAQEGFAVLTIDLPGKGINRLASRSSGPDMTVGNILKTKPDLSYNYLVHAVAAVRNGITLLTQRPEVDPERIGMIGLSWGGVLTLLTNGQDTRLKAAVNVFGAGFIQEASTWHGIFERMPAGEQELWNTFIDPKNFIRSQHAPILFITGTNDHCYYLPTFQKSYELVQAEKNIWLIPNLRHQFLPQQQQPAFTWLKQKLKTGGSWPEVAILAPFTRYNQVIIPVKATGNGSRLTDVRLHYAAGGPQQWTRKKWHSVKPYFQTGIFYFALPLKALQPEVVFYVSAHNAQGGAASSLVRSLFPLDLAKKSETLALSSPIRKTFQRESPFYLLGSADKGAGKLARGSDKAITLD